MSAHPADLGRPRWLARVRARLRALASGRSVKRRLVLLFLLVAVLLTGLFAVGAQRAFSVGWRDAARPLLADYVDRLAAEITGPAGGPPSTARARALTERLPITVRITGPAVTWASHPGQAGHDRGRHQPGALDDRQDWAPLLERRTADGHRIVFGMNREAFERRPGLLLPALAALLSITLGAYLCVRRLLQPLDDIAAGAQRFGAGEFGQPIPVRHPQQPDELGQLAATVNTMGEDIRRMLEAKRALLLAISHELRSPLTRARLPADLPHATVDRARIRLMLRNLLDNALRHGAGAPRPPVLRLDAAPDGGLTLEVRDHGPGVTEDQLSQLAEAFYRPDSARTRAAGGVGLGLGLYLCRLVAEAHGGRFAVRQARPGLAVTVTLPQR